MKIRKLSECDDYSQVKLCVGFIVDDQMITDLVIDRMVGVDEERLADKKLKNNNAKAITKLLRRIILSAEPVWSDTEFPYRETPIDIPRNMTQPDRDITILFMRALSFGDVMDVSYVCPKCEEKGEIPDFELGSIDIGYWEENKEPELRFKLIDGMRGKDNKLHHDVVMGFPTGRINEGVLQFHSKNLAKATTATLAECIKNIGDLDNIDHVEMARMTTKDRIHISETLEREMPGPRLRTDAICEECGHEWEAPISLENFSETKSSD